jgi:hypothetical protein
MLANVWITLGMLRMLRTRHAADQARGQMARGQMVRLIGLVICTVTVGLL